MKARARLIAALATPTLLGGVGMLGLDSITATFFLYLLGGCVAAPLALVGARPLAGAGGLPFAPPPAQRRGRAEIAMAVVFGPVFLVLYLVARPYLGDVSAYRARVEALGMDLDAPLLALVLFTLMNPLLEEWWWRGQATPRCVRAFGPRAGVALAIAGFGAYHLVLLAALFPLPVAIVRTILITATGYLWTRISLALGSWRGAYVAHLAADLAMVVVFVLVILA